MSDQQKPKRQSKLVEVPTGETARTIAKGLCEQLDQCYRKRAVASDVRAMLGGSLPDGYTGPVPSEKFIGWLCGLRILYRVRNCSWYGLRKEWKTVLPVADFDTAPGKFGSLRPELQPSPSPERT